MHAYLLVRLFNTNIEKNEPKCGRFLFTRPPPPTQAANIRLDLTTQIRGEPNAYRFQATVASLSRAPAGEKGRILFVATDVAGGEVRRPRPGPAVDRRRRRAWARRSGRNVARPG